MDSSVSPKDEIWVFARVPSHFKRSLYLIVRLFGNWLFTRVKVLLLTVVRIYGFLFSFLCFFAGKVETVMTPP
jgi:hypothetical protein